MLLFSALATNSRAMNTIAMPLESYTISSLLQVPRWLEPPPRMATITPPLRLSVMASLSVLCATRTTNQYMSEDRAKAWVEQLKGEGAI